MHTTSKDADLFARAQAVRGPVTDARVGAPHVARCLWGVMSIASRQFSHAAVQTACADLVRAEDAWTSQLAKLPTGLDLRVHPALEQIAVVARGLLAICDVETMRAALAFWAVEQDPREWQRVAGVAA